VGPDAGAVSRDDVPGGRSGSTDRVSARVNEVDSGLVSLGDRPCGIRPYVISLYHVARLLEDLEPVRAEVVDDETADCARSCGQGQPWGACAGVRAVELDEGLSGVSRLCRAVDSDGVIYLGKIGCGQNRVHARTRYVEIDGVKARRHVRFID